MLPKIELPKHECTLPVSGIKVEYRPFVVKEQKVLLQAIEMGGNKKQISSAVEDVITSCTFGKINIKELPLSDVEFLVLILRSKSVGENIELTYTCNECKVKTEFELSLSDVNVDNINPVDDKIILHEDIGLVMKPLSYGDIDVIMSESEDNIERGYSVIKASIKSVFDKDQVYSNTDFTQEELTQFLETLPKEYFEKVEEYVSKQPQLTSEKKIKCINCGHETNIKLNGLNDFLE